MSKKQNKLDSLLGIVKKGKKLYNEYGETVLSITNSIKKRNLASGTESSEALVDDVQEEKAIVKVDDKAITAMSKPTNIKGYREEIESDDSFHETLATLEEAVSFVYKGGPKNPEDVERALRILGEAAQDAIKYAEEQETKREEIRAMRDTAIAQINAMKECVQTYLEKTFDERSAIFAKQFEVVDIALQSGDNEMLASGLNSINALAASSPFKNLADITAVQKSLSSSDTEWDI
jgi:hypothetical protein